MTRMLPFLGLALAFFGLAAAQTPTNNGQENHPLVTTWECTKANGCVEKNTSLVLDVLVHPLHKKDAPNVPCGQWGKAPDPAICPDEETCATNCVLEPVTDYTDYGVTTDGGILTLKHLRDDGSVASPRVYLLSENKTEYEMLQLTGGEFTFDVDMSLLPCGMNGALYLSEMSKIGGESPLNKAGAYYGTGYCDAQCYVAQFANGVANIDSKGLCCNEMDIWEANRMAQSIAPHTCNQTSFFACTGAECEFDGVCDKWGCTYNTYTLGNKDFYGPERTVDTNRPFTVVTQFPTGADGRLKEIRRIYIQDGQEIENAAIISDTLPDINFLNDEFCAGNGAGRYMDLGGTGGMGDALARGMVLIFSLWWDEATFMQWLDGGNAGPCNPTEGDPKNIKLIQPDTAVTFSNIKWGEIGSTY